jgi:hypothetical protein
VLTAPAREKDYLTFLKDRTFYRLMSDMKVVIKGMIQSVALVLDNQGEVGVVHLAKAVALAANVLSRMNTERIRINYPREYAAKALKKNTEPILREGQRIKAKELAKEARDVNTVVNTLFSGRGGSARGRNFGRGKRGSLPRFSQYGRNRFN